MSIRVFIADDQAEIRKGLRLIIESDPMLTAVGEAASGTQAIEGIRATTPDVALVDIQMPGLDGIEVARAVGADTTLETRVVIVTTFDVDEYVYQALQHGAAGFILKRSRPQLLIEAVHAAAGGERLISPEVTIRLLERMHPASPSPSAARAVSPLSKRELEIAQEIATGKTNAEIGDALYISAGTVKTHVAAIQRKLGVKNRMGVALWVWQEHGVPHGSPPPS